MDFTLAHLNSDSVVQGLNSHIHLMAAVLGGIVQIKQDEASPSTTLKPTPQFYFLFEDTVLSQVAALEKGFRLLRRHVHHPHGCALALHVLPEKSHQNTTP